MCDLAFDAKTKQTACCDWRYHRSEALLPLHILGDVSYMNMDVNSMANWPALYVHASRLPVGNFAMIEVLVW